MKDLILLALDESATRQLLSRALRALDYGTVVASDQAGVEKLLQESNPALVIISERLGSQDSIPIIQSLSKIYPTLPIVFLAISKSPAQVQAALRAGISAYLEPPIKTDEIIGAIQNSLERANKLGDWLRLKVNQSTTSLQKRLDELEILLQVSRGLTSSLDVNDVLQKVVSAAVELTNAEEGSLLLLDEKTNELYMRAGHNFESGFADSFRMPVEDSLAGEVIRTGEPITYNKDRAHKIQTAYLIQSLIYAPLKIRDRIIGVLGVDHRIHQLPFSNRDTLLLSLLAEDAAVAIENAGLYQNAENERQKFETVIANMKDSLLMLDEKKQIQIINRSMAEALEVDENDTIGRIAEDIIPPGDLLELIKIPTGKTPRHYEVNLENGRVYSAQNTHIPNVGTAITMQDISHLKEINRLKDDFVHTVSHDLRSPLTAVLGYAELIERVGEVNDMQKDFVGRIRGSVSDITSLIDELLDLGRIEAGFDKERELIQLGDIIQDTLQSFETLHTKKEQTLEIDITPDLPSLHGNALRIRQMCDNLIANAIKYTDNGKKVCIKLHKEDDELIFSVGDQGPGIPFKDQTRIFEKFYRAQNAVGKESGTGLGLAIVKTIVENHQGRIWVESKLGEGSQFFVVLPTAPKEA